MTNHATKQLTERFKAQLTTDRLEELLNSSDAIRVMDNPTGNINTYVHSEFSSSSLMRITTPRDETHDVHAEHDD